MAGKTKTMSQIKQLIRLHEQGHGIKHIARVLLISKNTVKVYLDKVIQNPHSIRDLLKMEDNELHLKLHIGNPSYKDLRYDVLAEKFKGYAADLKKTGVTRQTLWEEYRSENPNGYSRTQFCHHLAQYLHIRKPSFHLTHLAGDKLFIDFAGKPMSYTDPSTGEVIKCQVFVACLPYSDYAFAMAVKSQKVEDFLYALQCCLYAIGGVPKSLGPDNLKAAVIKTDRYEPTINRAMEDFANHYGTAVVPARAAKPKDKALVENQVKLIYQRVYAKLRNETFFSLSSLNQAIQEKVKKHNQTRMQQKPYCREEQFLANEKKLLAPLPQERFEIKYYTTLAVAHNNHIYMGRDKHYYSVPYTYIGQKVNVVYTRNIVRISSNNVLIANHIRSYKQGGYTSEDDHLCSSHQNYKKRSPEYYIKKAGEGILNEFFEAVFEIDRPPEQLYRRCDGLLNLKRKTNTDIFQKACRTAIDNDMLTCQFVEKLIENKSFINQEDLPETPLPKHNNIRGKGYYAQTSINFNNYDED